MADDTSGLDEAALAIVARHALHDEELVAALAAGGLDDDAELDRARSFIERCTACRALHDDIAAIGSALKLESNGSIAAPRDFRLSVEDARRLGGTVRVGGFRATLLRSLASFGRPIGATLGALGVVGLLVASLSLGVGSAGPLAAGTGAAGPTGAPAQIQTGAGNPDAPKGTDARAAAIVPGSSSFSSEAGYQAPQDGATPGINPAVWLLGASVLLIVFGAGLLVVAIRRNP